MRHAGLYDSRFEHDACGIGFVADAGGRASRGVVDAALAALHRVRHRGAVAADHRSGDGAGLLLVVPDAFYATGCSEPASTLSPLPDLAWPSSSSRTPRERMVITSDA